MKNKKITFVGIGNMGSAILLGVLNNKLIKEENIIIFDRNVDKLEVFKKKYNVNIASSFENAIKNTDIILIAVKPNALDDTLNVIKNFIKKDTLILSIVAGVSINQIEEKLNANANVKVIRIMPNTPALIGEAMSSISKSEYVSEEEVEFILDIFNKLGKAELVSEKLIDVVTGLSGSGPAYVYMFIEALADGAVLNGMPRDMAYKFAAQTVLGSAKMILETKKHPAELKDMVTSPSGTTIEAVRMLENNNFRSAVIEAVNVATQKSKKLSK